MRCWQSSRSLRHLGSGGEGEGAGAEDRAPSVLRRETAFLRCGIRTMPITQVGACGGLKVEAGRAWMGNAIYRYLMQALVMVQVDQLVLTVSNVYKYQSGGKAASSTDYKNTCNVADTLYAHTRVKLPYGLTVIGF
jgi:hypothetical protein